LDQPHVAWANELLFISLRAFAAVVPYRGKMTELSCIELDSPTAATASVIWLHGLGADGHDFESIVPGLELPKDAAVRFIFPNAPSIPVTINGGFVMPAWYDVLEWQPERKWNEEQLAQSARATQALVDREIERGIDSRKIVLAGFSQGGAVCYEAALTYPQPLAGLMTLSTYFATIRTITPSPANRELPIWVTHGRMDQVVDETLGQKSVKDLREQGYEPEYKTYAMDHGVCPEQIADISAWLRRVLLID
jgi:phospholipase/carboxylesterase